MKTKDIIRDKAVIEIGTRRWSTGEITCPSCGDTIVKSRGHCDTPLNETERLAICSHAETCKDLRRDCE